MSDVVSAAFDALPYRHGSVPESHPARLGAIARLLGVAAAAPDRCRVLELGCAEGMNLLPLAERFPGGTFVGVDFSPQQIATGERARVAAGLANVRLVTADLRTFEPEAGAFDYVIAHGVYSWVADEVKDHLLRICARALAPQGVAYVSYNVLPGWGLAGSLRAILRAELAQVADPRAHAPRLLAALERALAGQSGQNEWLHELVQEMRAKPTAMLWHDDLEAINDPVTFLDFTAHSARHGLHYLGEAHFASLPIEHLPATAREALAGLDLDFLRSQQMLDLIGGRKFRNSLLVRTPPKIRTANPEAIADCAVGSHLWPEGGRIDLASALPLRLAGRRDFQLAVEKPARKAFFAALCEARPGPLAFRAALDRAEELLRASAQPEVVEPAPLLAGLLRLFTLDQCDLLLAGDAGWLHAAVPPSPSPLMRYQARHDLPVVNRWHHVVDLSPEDRRWVAGEAASDHESALIRSGLVA